jgi:membrane-associated phospholipid phosphatase
MNDLFEPILTWDKSLFQVMNGTLSNPFFDAFCPFFREKWFWAPLYLFVLAFSLLNFGARGWLIVLGLVLSVGAADLTSSRVLKKNIQRVRPCNDPEMVENTILRVSCGSGYSFTSSHAANHFAAAVFLLGIFGARARWIRPALLGWAGAVSFSQIYVGVHYPADVVCGGLVGAAIGWWAVQTFRRLGWQKTTSPALI